MASKDAYLFVCNQVEHMISNQPTNPNKDKIDKLKKKTVKNDLYCCSRGELIFISADKDMDLMTALHDRNEYRFA
ncbi:17899_t:CDS:2 [Dentiscutata erythropus]|uniref:17899_t:CDS:1 n=1 Tax=Dentiscutata erythropus TaxID=1348616 RepID=A0A9N8WCT7_9GLOM|nr:17899_t:CDS:2 [Dentiscutata erythropus]